MTTFADPFTRVFTAAAGASKTAAPQGRVGLAPEARTQIADQATALRALMRQQQQRQQLQQQPKPQPQPPQRQGGSPAQHRPATPRAARRATVVAITSGKGGVGKSNVAVNLAIKLTAAGKRVVLLDADMGLANADVLCNLDCPTNLSHVLSRKKDLKEIMVKAPGGFHLIGGASGLARMADLSDSDRRRLTEALSEIEHLADVILIDTGAGISPNVLSFTRAADHVLVVTTPEPTAITDAYALIKTIAKRDPECGPQRVSLLVNQTRSPAEARAVVDRIAKVARQFLNLDIFDAGSVPEDEQVRAAVRRRSPVLISAPKSPAAVAIAQLATRLEQGVPPVRDAGFFTKVNRWFRK